MLKSESRRIAAGFFYVSIYAPVFQKEFSALGKKIFRTFVGSDKKSGIIL
ncbi:hypothetical protein HMPREF1221_01171 [Treponema socranskii subsp. paredis ATCC 35535]|nr:hypothetical protein HMPREF1221_01171 [Treponema socranskii subsp. paredis ATCC 35535]